MYGSWLKWSYLLRSPPHVSAFPIDPDSTEYHTQPASLPSERHLSLSLARPIDITQQPITSLNVYFTNVFPLFVPLGPFSHNSTHLWGTRSHHCHPSSWCWPLLMCFRLVLLLLHVTVGAKQLLLCVLMLKRPSAVYSLLNCPDKYKLWRVRCMLIILVLSSSLQSYKTFRIFKCIYFAARQFCVKPQGLLHAASRRLETQHGRDVTWRDVTCPRLWLTPGVITITQPLLTYYVKGALSVLSFSPWLGSFLALVTTAAGIRYWRKLAAWLLRDCFINACQILRKSCGRLRWRFLVKRLNLGERGEVRPKHPRVQMTNEFPCLVLVNQALHCQAQTIPFLWQLCVNVLCTALLRPLLSACCVYQCLRRDRGYCTVSLLRISCVRAVHCTVALLLHARLTPGWPQSVREWWGGAGYQCHWCSEHNPST